MISKRELRKKRIRKKIFGTTNCPRLCVYRSLKHLEAQIIDDSKGETLVHETSKNKKFKNKTEMAKKVGAKIAQKAKAKKITKVCFDRGGFKYHGRIKILAEEARKQGLKF